jgi:hypothetical protein
MRSAFLLLPALGAPTTRRCLCRRSREHSVADCRCRAGSTGLADGAEAATVAGMSTVAEIETAVEKLTPEELREFAAWFEERQMLLNSSGALFRMYDDEERAS